MAVWRFWMMVLGLILFFSNPNPINAETVDALGPGRLVAPVVEPIEPAKQEYRVGDTIIYQVRVHWPELAEPARLNSPEISTENLQFTSVSQETVTEGNVPAGIDQILSFKFATQKPGPAKVRRFSLRWTYGQGLETIDMTVPALELTVKRPALALWKPILLTVAGFFSLAAAGGILFLINVKKRKREVSSDPFVNQLEENALAELEKLKGEWKTKGDDRHFLSGLNQIFYRYLEQKLGWNPAKGGYNDVQKMIAEKWSKKDASELKELVEQLEFMRFSQGSKDRNVLDQLSHTISSFVGRRKIS